MLVIDRRYDEVLQETPSVPSYPMNGRYILDYPMGVDLTASEIAYTWVNTLVSTNIPEKILALYPSYDYVEYDALLDSSTLFDNTEYFPRTTGVQKCRNKSGATPNVACLLKMNNNSGAGWYGVGITQEIEIDTRTEDGLGRETFLVYWRFVEKSVSEDKTPTVHDASNEASKVTYEDVTESSSLLYSVYISGDGGSTYQEVQHLRPYSFTSAVTSVRLAFVNKSSQDDVYLLSYALLF